MKPTERIIKKENELLGIYYKQIRESVEKIVKGKKKEIAVKCLDGTKYALNKKSPQPNGPEETFIFRNDLDSTGHYVPLSSFYKRIEKNIIEAKNVYDQICK